MAAKNLWLDMIKEQQKISNEGQHIGLSRNDQQRWVHTPTHTHTHTHTLSFHPTPSSFIIWIFKLVPSSPTTHHTHVHSIMNNAKLIASRIREAQKSLQQAGRNFAEVNMAFRTMDKDINTIRPELMRLQWEKEQYTM